MLAEELERLGHRSHRRGGARDLLPDLAEGIEALGVLRVAQTLVAELQLLLEGLVLLALGRGQSNAGLTSSSSLGALGSFLASFLAAGGSAIAWSFLSDITLAYNNFENIRRGMVKLPFSLNEK